MSNLFVALFFISFVCLIIGLIKPVIFSKFIKNKLTRKKIGKIFGVSTIVFFILIGVVMDSPDTKNQDDRESVVENVQDITSDSNIVPVDEKEDKKIADTSIPADSKEKEVIMESETIKQEIIVPPTTELETTTAPVVKVEPAKQEVAKEEGILAILKANAVAKWGTDYKMIQYEYNNQVEAYNWVVAQTKYLDIMTNAKKDWGVDYKMVKYEYNNQVEDYEWIMAQTKYPAIMESAKQKWGSDYGMVKYEYNNQVEAYEKL